MFKIKMSNNNETHAISDWTFMMIKMCSLAHVCAQVTWSNKKVENEEKWSCTHEEHNEGHGSTMCMHPQ